MINKRTREKLNRLLQERNEYPERADDVDARIDAVFGDTLAVMVMDMSGFCRQTVRYGINHFLAKIHRYGTEVNLASELGEDVAHGGEILLIRGRLQTADRRAGRLRADRDVRVGLEPDGLQVQAAGRVSSCC